MPSANLFGISCNNCGGSHVVGNCTEPKDQDRITRNAKAWHDRFRENKANNLNSNRNRNLYGGDQSNGGNRNNNGQHNGKLNNYGHKQWGKPRDNDIVCKIESQAYVACKICGWNKGKSAHMTGSHPDYDQSPNSYKTSLALKAEIE